MARKNYIGLACTGHDNALAIVDSKGELVFAEATERYTQLKRAIDCPPDDVFRIGKLINQYCEKDAEIVFAKTWSENTNDFIELMRENVTNIINNSQDTHEEWLARYYALMYMADLASRNINNAGLNLKFFCDSQKINITEKAYDHHLTHAAAGAYTSPFEDAAIVIIDGIGEGQAISLFSFKESEITYIDTDNKELTDMVGSLGFFYSYICKLCGFVSFQGEEWKVMGLAAYGKYDEEIYQVMRRYISVDRLKILYPETSQDAYIELLKFAKKPEQSYEDLADLAYTGQYYFAEMMNSLLNSVYELGISENIILGGGCALNSSYAGKILTNTDFKSLYIYSAPADDGNAVGAAYLAYYEDNQRRHEPRFFSPYVGSSIAKVTLKNISKFSNTSNLEILDKKAVCKKTAKLLADGNIIGWMQGRAEFGPRALGNRSILANPCLKDMKDKINASVKFREEYRPFAPAILDEFGNEYFKDYQQSPYMERTLYFKENAKHKVPAVVHQDGTGRLQTVKRQWNEAYYDLIFNFYKITDVPIVLNTSFNIMGKPIIHSVEDAIAVFYTSGIDVLVIENYMIYKERM